MAAIFTVPAVFKAVDKISATTRRMQKSVKKFGLSARANMQRASLAFQRFNNKVKSVGRGITKSLGPIGTAIGAMAIVSVIGSAINIFADFEQANANLASVMGVTVEQNSLLTKDSLRLGAITAKTSAEVVGLQEAFARLGFERTDILNMTQSTIASSIAMRSELAETAELVGAVVKTFDELSSRDAGLINDQMVKATQASALNFEKLSTALPIVGGAANALKVPFSRTLALLGKLSDSGIDASMSATALRKIFIVSAAKGIPYEKMLLKVANSQDKLKTANELFGKTAAVQAVILAKNISGIAKLDKTLQGAAGTAESAANKQLNTLRGRLTILGSAWEGFILSMESGNGAFATTLKTVVEVATQFLAMATGTAKAKDELTSAELRVRNLAEKLKTFLKIIGTIAKGYAIMIAMQATINIGLKAYQVLTKVGHFLKFARVFAVMAKAKGLAAAAQWALNIAMSANPIGLIIIGIAALIGIIILMVKKWDVVKATIMRVWAIIEKNPILKILIGPIYLVIKAIQFLVANFGLIKEAVINAITPIIGLFSSIFSFFEATSNFIGAVFKVAFYKVVNGFILPLFEKFKSFITKVRLFFKPLTDMFTPLIEIFKIIGNTIKEHIMDKFKFIGGLVDKVSNFFGGAAESINKETDKIIKRHELEVKVDNLLKKPSTNDVTKRLANNLVDNEKGIINSNNTNTVNQNSVIASDFNKPIQQKNQKNSVDIFINNRSSESEIFTDGTGVNVQNTGF